MASNEGAVSILHLSTVVSALTIAYLKFDHTYEGRDAMDGALQEVRETAHEVMQQLDLSPFGVRDLSRKNGRVLKLGFLDKLRFLAILFPACLICRLADRKIELGRFVGFCHLVYRQGHAPMYGYYRKHVNLIIVACLAVCSTTIMFSIAGGLIWDAQWVRKDVVLRATFVALLLMLLWVVATSAASVLLDKDRLKKKCRTLEKVVQARIEKIKDRARGTLNRFKGPSGPDLQP